MLKRTFYMFGALSMVWLLLSGCMKTFVPQEIVEKVHEPDKKVPVDTQEKSDEVDFEGLVERETEVQDFPEWLPRPSEFIVILDMDGGAMRSVVLEASEADIPAMVARFNKEIAAIDPDGILAEEVDEDTGLYSAFGQISYGDYLVMISIGEYEPGGALVDGNKGSVT
ncbi:hypothetical protein J4G37_40410, partial [Microvirga sp. 3-52]|nr:hypothetical protein [Microvirga sp. 3-52]